VVGTTIVHRPTTPNPSLSNEVVANPFSWDLGARGPAGMSDCLENTRGEILLSATSGSE